MVMNSRRQRHAGLLSGKGHHGAVRCEVAPWLYRRGVRSLGVSGAMGLPSGRYFWQSGAVLSSKRVSSMLEAVGI